MGLDAQKIKKFSRTENEGYSTSTPTSPAGQTNNRNSSPRQTSYTTAKPNFVENKMFNPFAGVNVNDMVSLAMAIRQLKGKAVELLEAGEYQAVADICFAGLKVLPKDEEFMILMGQAYRYNNDRENAIIWFKKASRQIPGDANLGRLITHLLNGGKLD